MVSPAWSALKLVEPTLQTPDLEYVSNRKWPLTYHSPKSASPTFQLKYFQLFPGLAIAPEGAEGPEGVQGLEGVDGNHADIQQITEDIMMMMTTSMETIKTLMNRKELDCIGNTGPDLDYSKNENNEIYNCNTEFDLDNHNEYFMGHNNNEYLVEINEETEAEIESNENVELKKKEVSGNGEIKSNQNVGLEENGKYFSNVNKNRFDLETVEKGKRWKI